jgi:hypothetical protein
MYIDHSKLTQWTVDCRSLENAVDLKQLLSPFARGTYELYFIYQGKRITIKFGMTADNKQGERMYRQIWRFPGWPTEPGPNSAGDDLDDTVVKILAEYPRLTKDNVFVHVWDMTALPPINRLRPEHEPYMLEGQLIEEFADREGHCPIGNKREQSRLVKGLTPRLTKSVPSDVVLDRLFYSE